MENLLYTMILIHYLLIQSSKKRGRSFFNDSVKSRLLSFSISFDSLHRYHYRSLPCSRSWTLNLLPVIREIPWFHQFLNDRFPRQLSNFQKWINIIDSYIHFKWNSNISWMYKYLAISCNIVRNRYIRISKLADRREFRTYVQ